MADNQFFNVEKNTFFINKKMYKKMFSMPIEPI